MADFEGRSKQAQGPSDNMIIDWERIYDGSPRYVTGWNEEEKAKYYRKLPRPIKVGTKDEHGNVREPDQVDRYPSGPWEVRGSLDSTPEGRKWVNYWVHVEVVQRSKLPNFKRRSGEG